MTTSADLSGPNGLKTKRAHTHTHTHVGERRKIFLFFAVKFIWGFYLQIAICLCICGVVGRTQQHQAEHPSVHALNNLSHYTSQLRGTKQNQIDPRSLGPPNPSTAPRAVSLLSGNSLQKVATETSSCHWAWDRMKFSEVKRVKEEETRTAQVCKLQVHSHAL